jgi:dolichyl-phosphate-mannose-protein mannosyltransferase
VTVDHRTEPRNALDLGIAERHAWIVLAAMSALYLAATFGRASQRLFWHDELVTVYMSRLPRIADVWAAIELGAEATPPLFPITTRAAVALLGEGLITVRLPETIGFLVAMLCAYTFVARRFGTVFGLIAFLIPAATDAYVYAYEARPYGLILGFAGGAMIAWQHAAEGRRRAIALPILFASLSGAILCHYYAAVLLAPFLVGEGARIGERRKADWAVLSVLVLSLVPLVFLLPLIRSAAAGGVGFFSAIRPRAVIEGYELVLGSLGVPALGVAIVGGLLLSMRRATPLEESAGTAPLHEWIAMITLTLLPLVGASAAGFVVGAFVMRYAMPWILGFSVLVAFMTASSTRYPRTFGMVTLAALVAWTAVKFVPSATLLTHDAPTLSRTHYTILFEPPSTLPIVVTHAHTFLPMVEYMPPQIAARLVLLTAPPRLVSQWGPEAREEGLTALAKVIPIHVEEFDAFIAKNRHFLLYGPPMWLPGELRAAGAKLTLKGEEREAVPFAMSDPGQVFLYEVTFE